MSQTIGNKLLLPIVIYFIFAFHNLTQWVYYFNFREFWKKFCPNPQLGQAVTPLILAHVRYFYTITYTSASIQRILLIN